MTVEVGRQSKHGSGPDVVDVDERAQLDLLPGDTVEALVGQDHDRSQDDRGDAGT